MDTIKIPAPNLVTQVSPEGLINTALALHEYGGDMTAARLAAAAGISTSTAQRRLAHTHRLGLSRARLVPVSGPVFRSVYQTSVSAQVNFSMKNKVLDALSNDPLRRVFSEVGAKGLERLFYLHYDWSLSTRNRRAGSIHHLAHFYETTERDSVEYSEDYDADFTSLLSDGLRFDGRFVQTRTHRAQFGSVAPSKRNVGDANDRHGLNIITTAKAAPANQSVIMGSMASLNEAMRQNYGICTDCGMARSAAGACWC